MIGTLPACSNRPIWRIRNDVIEDSSVYSLNSSRTKVSVDRHDLVQPVMRRIQIDQSSQRRLNLERDDFAGFVEMREENRNDSASGAKLQNTGATGR